MVVVVLVYQLEILYGGLIHTPVEVEHKCLHLLVPLGRLVEEEHDVFRVINFELLLDRVFIINGAPGVLLALQVHVRQQYLHAAGALAAQHVRFVLNYSLLVPQIVLARRGLLDTLAVVEDRELRAQKVRPYFAEVAARGLLHLIGVSTDHILRRG